MNSSESPVIVRQLEKFELSSRKLTSFRWVPDNPISDFPPVIDLPIDLPGINNVMFGLYYSPNFIATDGVAAGSIPQTPTGQAIVFPKTPVVDKKNPGFVPDLLPCLPALVTTTTEGFPGRNLRSRSDRFSVRSLDDHRLHPCTGRHRYHCDGNYWPRIRPCQQGSIRHS